MNVNFKSALACDLIHGTKDSDAVYSGNVSKTWCIGAIPHGGYVLGLVLTAAIDYQSPSPHPDIIHISAHYLISVEVTTFEVRVRRMRQGKRLTNVEAELVQSGVLKIAVRFVFGVLPDMTKAPTSDPLTLNSPPLARHIPLRLHPLDAKPDELDKKFRFKVILAEDLFFTERNAIKAKSPGPINSDSSSNSDEEKGTLEWGCWCQLPDPNDVMDASMIPFFADLVKNLPELLPPEQRPGPSWYATVVLSVEFKSKIPSFVSDNTSFSPRTVGLYSTGRFMSEGRHDSYVEVWTAPSIVGGTEESAERKRDNDWREKQICLAVAHQMALTIPLEVNLRKKAQRTLSNSKL